MDVGFTANLEERLDTIAQVQWSGRMCSGIFTVLLCGSCQEAKGAMRA